jgi:hypothetical protein
MSAPDILYPPPVGGGTPVGGSGTGGTIPRWSGAGASSTLTDSELIQSATGIYTTTRNIGIGVDPGTVKLRITGGAANDWIIRGNASGTIGQSYGALLDAGTNASDTAFQLRSASGASTHLYVRGDGYVGIGTASPLALVHANGSSSGAVQAFIRNTNGGTNSSAELAFGVWSGAIPTGSGNPGPSAKLVALNENAANASTSLTFWTYNGSGTPASAERARIDSTGNVLLNTQTAAGGYSPLVINGLSGSPKNGNAGIQLNYNGGAYGGGAITTVNAAGGGLAFYTYTGNIGGESYTERARIDSSGNLILNSATTNATIQATGTGQGLKLNSTPSATGAGTEQILDCYAEGTWSPTPANFGGTTPTITSARYTRVGRVVTLQVLIQATGANPFSSTAGNTYLPLPSGMTPAISAPGSTSESGIAADGPCVAYDNGRLYLPTFALRLTNTYLNVTYTV